MDKKLFNLNTSGEIEAIAGTIEGDSLTTTGVTGKPLTGYVSGAGVVAAADSILEAIQKLDGNIAALPEGSGRRQIYDISAGSVPPSSGAVGTTLGYFQSQDFDPSTNNDVYFQFAVPDNTDITAPVKIILKYCVSTDNGGDVKLDLDYIASDVADDVDPAAATGTLTSTFTPGAGAELLRSHSIFEIDAADLASINTVVSCHLTRDAVDGADDHTGAFQLLSIEIEYTPIELGSGGGGDVGAWTSYTPTGTWITNVIYTGFYRIVGDTMELRGRISLSGQPDNLMFGGVSLPTGWQIDTAKMPTLIQGCTTLGVASFLDTGTGALTGYTLYDTTTSVRPVAVITSGAYASVGNLIRTLPFTFANGDAIEFQASFPVVGV